MSDTRLSDIKEETSVDLDDAENGVDPELEKSIKQLFEAAKRGWVLIRNNGLERILSSLQKARQSTRSRGEVQIRCC